MGKESDGGDDWDMPTESVHAGEMHDASGSHIDPIHMTSTYVFEDSEAISAWASGESGAHVYSCLLYTSPSPRDQRGSRMPSSA